MILIFLGMPGSGKGTFASKLIDEYDYIHISTGDIFRNLSKEKSPLALKVKKTIDSGQLVNDELTWEVFKSSLDKFDLNKEKIIFDGYPRNKKQYDILEKYLSENNFLNYKIIHFSTTENTVIERLSKRKFCPVDNKTYHDIYNPSPKGIYCEDGITKLIVREDDSLDKIKTRLEIFHQTTQKLIDSLQKENKLIVVDANKNTNNIISELKKYVKF